MVIIGKETAYIWEVYMKNFKDSTLDYKCVSGCGINIYNATRGYKDNKCPICGGHLKKLVPIKNTQKRGKND